jgi:4-amino-4-deoxy-L-arabinose transferase-like glycosyltransferase
MLKHIFMPKASSSSKTKAKNKNSLKAKRAAQPKTPDITTKKSYWLMLTVFIVIIFSVAGYILKFAIVDLIVLMISIVLLIGLIGYVRISPSNLSASRRGTFLFVGASIIGFGIWAIIMLILMNTGTIDTLFGSNVFYILPSLIICLTAGAFIGELMGKNGRVQQFFFKPTNDL